MTTIKISNNCPLPEKKNYLQTIHCKFGLSLNLTGMLILVLQVIIINIIIIIIIIITYLLTVT